MGKLQIIKIDMKILKYNFYYQLAGPAGCLTHPPSPQTVSAQTSNLCCSWSELSRHVGTSRQCKDLRVRDTCQVSNRILQVLCFTPCSTRVWQKAMQHVNERTFCPVLTLIKYPILYTCNMLLKWNIRIYTSCSILHVLLFLLLQATSFFFSSLSCHHLFFF
jgi:hypothetical protein